MNKLNTSIIATLIVLTMVFFLGRLFLLAGPQNELEQMKNRLQTLVESEAQLANELEKLRNNLKNQPVDNRSSRLMRAGEESSILKFILANTGGGFKLNNFELLPSFRVKPAEGNDYSNAPAMSFDPENMPQLDENGNPVGMFEESDEEWPGIEIVPARFTFVTTPQTLGVFLSEVSKKLPMNAVRQMDLLLKTTGTVRGTITLNFPVAEPAKK